MAARLSFDGVALSRVPVGVTAAFPSVMLTAEGPDAVVHLVLPIANCLTPEAPPVLADSGCLPTETEFADLSTPALRVTRHGAQLALAGRFPTYRRPVGDAAVRTGREHDVTVVLDLPHPTGAGWIPADGAVTVDGRTVRALTGRGLTAVRYAG